MQNTVGQIQQQPQAAQQAIPQAVPVQTVTQPQAYIQPPQTQAMQVPNYSGVNIQIFNPSVGAPGAAPSYNVNAPSYQTNPNGGSCYPSEYYTNKWGQQGNSGVQNQTTTNETINKTTNETTDKTKKTEKRQIVELTDEYIMNLENYLNSQDPEVRLMGAKEVVARLEEDASRKDDKALNALVNKMLQDPSPKIKILALSMLDARVATGDDFTVQVLKTMQNSTSGYGQDAIQASNILLKMSGKTVEKEFEVKEKDEPKKTEENKQV